MNFLLIPAYAFLNRARGTKLFSHTDSTELARLIATMSMALGASINVLPDTSTAIEVFAWVWATLMLWCTPAWDKLWSATIGHDPDHSRLWGLRALSFRMTLAAPIIVGLALIMGKPLNSLYAFGTLALGLPYYIWGYLKPLKPIDYAECTVGAILGFLVILTMS